MNKIISNKFNLTPILCILGALLTGCQQDPPASKADPIIKINSDHSSLSMYPYYDSAPNTKTIKLTNTGNTVITGLNGVLTGQNSKDFSLSGLFNSNLEPQQSIDVVVTTTAKHGDESAELQILSSANSLDIPIRVVDRNFDVSLVNKNTGVISSGDSVSYQFTNNSDIDLVDVEIAANDNNQGSLLSHVSSNTCGATIKSKSSCNFSVDVANSSKTATYNVSVNGFSQNIAKDSFNVARPSLSFSTIDLLNDFKGYSSPTSLYGLNDSDGVFLSAGVERQLVVKNDSDATVKNLHIFLPNISGLIVDDATTCKENMTLNAHSNCSFILKGGLVEYPSGSDNLSISADNADNIDMPIIGQADTGDLLMSNSYVLDASSGSSLDNIDFSVINNSLNAFDNLKVNFLPQDDKSSSFTSNGSTCSDTIVGKGSCKLNYNFKAPLVDRDSKSLYHISYGNSNISTSRLLGLNLYNDFFTLPALIADIASPQVHDIATLNNVLYIATSSSISISKDHGKTWINYDHDFDKAIPESSFKNISVDNDGDIYAISANNDVVFARLLPSGNYQWLNQKFDGDYQIYKIIAHDNYALLSVAKKTSYNSGELFKFHNNTFSRVNNLIPVAGIRSLYIKDSKLYFGTFGGGFYICPFNQTSGDINGECINQSSNGYVNSHGYSITSYNNKIYVGESDGVEVSSDLDGTSWQDFKIDNVQDVHFTGIENGYIYTSSSAGNFNYAQLDQDGFPQEFKNISYINSGEGAITDDGFIALASSVGVHVINSLTNMSNPDNWKTYNSLNGLAGAFLGKVFASGNDIYAASDEGLLYSHDKGLTWNVYSVKTTNGQLKSNSIRDFYIYNDDILLATGDGFSISEDKGKNFTTYTYADAQELPVNNSIETVLELNDKIYLTSWGGCFSVITKAADGSLSFKKITDTISATSYDFYTDDNVNLYVAHHEGLSVSHDGGLTWSKYIDKPVGKVVIKNGHIFIITRAYNEPESFMYASLNSDLSDSSSWHTYIKSNDANGRLNNIFVDDNNTVFLSTGSGLDIGHPDAQGIYTFSTKNTSNGIGSNTVTSAYVDGSTEYISSANGLSVHGTMLFRAN